MQGTKFPTDASNIQSIEFAKQKCSPVIGEGLIATELTCILENVGTCGQHHPILITIDGTIPVDQTVAKEEISCQVS